MGLDALGPVHRHRRRGRRRPGGRLGRLPRMGGVHGVGLCPVVRRKIKTKFGGEMQIERTIKLHGTGSKLVESGAIIPPRYPDGIKHKLHQTWNQDLGRYK